MEDARGQSFGDAVLPTFIQEKQDLGTEQFADLLLNEVLAWSRDETQPRRKAISLYGLVHDMLVGIPLHLSSRSPPRDKRAMSKTFGLCPDFDRDPDAFQTR